MKAILSILLAFAQSAEPPRGPSLVREEHFSIELAPGDAIGPADPIAAARLSRLVDGDAVQLEWDVRFRGDDLRVRQVERFVRDGELESDVAPPRMIWRELRRHAGRTIVVDDPPRHLAHAGSARGARPWRLREWGGPNAVQSELPREPELTFLLTLLEQCRDGVVGDTVRMFDPLCREIVALRVERPLSVRAVAAAAGSPARASEALPRTVRLWRPDGTLFLELELRGDELETIQWGEQGLRAKRIRSALLDEDQTQF